MHPQMSNTYITHAEQYVPAEDTSRVVNQRGMIERVILVILAFDRDYGHLYQGAATPMYPVLAAATGIKLESMDQDGSLVAIKGSRQFVG